MRWLGFLLLFLLAPLAHAGDPPRSPLGDRRDAEAGLLDLSLLPHIKKLQIWDDAESSFRPPRSDESAITGAPVLVLHLWADYCQPCLREFPILRDYAEQLEAEHAGKVRFVYVSLTSTPSDMRAFLLKHRGILPKAPQFSDTTLEEDLQRYLAASLALPATLVLDERRQVRAAVLGSIAHRRAQLGRTIARLVASPSPACAP